MKTYIMAVMVLLTASVYGQGTGAFATDCPTIEQQQAAYNLSKAAGIVVRDTYTQQLQCHYQQLGTYFQQLHKTNQQIAKDIQQIAKDKQQIAKDAQQVATDAAQKAKALELAAREAIVKNNEEECNDMYVFCNELKVIIEKPDCADKEVSDHVKSKINHSGGGDSTNPGGGGNENGFFNPHN